MKLKLKIWLILGLLMLLVLVVFSVFELHEAEESARADLRRQALELRAVVMATRRIYHEQFQRSGLPLTEQTLGFLPAHAMSRISADIRNWGDSRSRFNNVSDRPRNPANLADASELAAMAWHRAHARASERIAVIRDADGEDYFHFTAPIWTEPYCLNCHASKTAAPATIGRRYDQAYDYQVGDLRGVMSIKIPMRELNQRAGERWKAEFIERLLMLLILMAVLGLLLNRLVINRLDRLGDAVRRMAAGDYGGKIGASGSDEIDELSRSFDQMAEAVLQRDSALASSEMRSRALAELAPVGLFRTDAAGSCIYVNEQWQRITGLDAAAAVGEGWQNMLHPADRARVMAEWHTASAAGRPFSGETRLLPPSGEVSWVLMRASAEIGPDGTVIGYVGTITDITARKRAEELEHFSAFQAGIAEMNTSVPHNVGNAITAVSQEAEAIEQASGEVLRVADLLGANAAGGETELAGQSGPVAALALRQRAIQREAAQALRLLGERGLSEHARRLGSGVRHIADIVRVQQSAALPNTRISSISLKQSIQSALELQGDVIRRVGIDVVVDVDPAVEQIRHSHNRLLQVLVNVIKNSIEAIQDRAGMHSGKGGPVVPFQGRIEIRAEPLPGDRFRLTITDNGIGFEPAMHDRLFQFGFSTKQRGSGIGLHSVAVYARESAGGVGLQSDGVGRGARLTVELPICIKPQQAPDTKQ